MISRIDHVSIAVRDYEKAERFFRDVLGVVQGAAAEDPNMKYVWRILSLGDLSRLELLNPTGEGSFLDGFLKNREGGVHHITLQTPDIQRARKALEDNGIPYFGYNEYPGGIWKELFIHPRDAFGVLIQLAEFTPDDWLSDSVKLPEGRRWSVGGEGDSIRLSLSHPGGGTATVKLTRDEAMRLAIDLHEAL
ncbi:MAG TPA: VOC family protein [Spirochaetota bacterium]|jgi:methylmalonyl-CoA/ethylmalonyl-CoA epimerase|nr:VOC family protein [Spirochaetota bacterium]OPZ37921.1 MAG: Glyoxalase-like domain protein [Spirochaetes bacterium ADurb.BinA120]HNU91570.1 VOC family protein [Spirochaetota bacterium]HPO44740.1 VOC family protein [Spirochaetota bacterium]HPV98187.1 VOC family protein [Spirochaetota bacterium]